MKLRLDVEDCALVVGVVLVLLLVAWAALGATFVWAPGTDPAVVACVQSCASQCGLEGRPAGIADTVTLRRALAASSPP